MNFAWLHAHIASPILTIGHMQLEYIVLRSLPFLVCGCLAAHHTVRARVSWGALLSALLCSCYASPALTQQLASSSIALLYYVVCAYAVFRFEPLLARGSVRADSQFCLLFAVLVFIPATFFRAFSAVPMLVFGWFMTLAAHSYCLERARTKQATSFGVCLSFLLVDPTLVFVERATLRKTSLSMRLLGQSALRILLGLSLMILGRYALAVLLPLAQEARHDVRPWAQYGGVMAATLPAFLALYWLRSGFADVQIGLMRALGYDIGECFDRPYLARTPVDFWRRWNLYVGHWARRYVFTPLSLALLRKSRRLRFRGAAVLANKIGAVLLTFLFVGLLHDALNYAGEQTTNFPFVSVFMFAAAALFLWEAIQAILPMPATHAAEARWFHGLSRLYLAHYLVGLVALSGAIS